MNLKPMIFICLLVSQEIGKESAAPVLQLQVCCIVCPVTGWTFLWGQLYLPVHYSNKCKNIKLTFYFFLVYWNKTSNYKYKDTKISVFRNSPMSLKKSLRILRMTHIYIYMYIYSCHFPHLSTMNVVYVSWVPVQHFPHQH